MKAVPHHLSHIPEGTDIEAAHVGARLQRLPMTPQGELVAGVMESKNDAGHPLYKRVVVQIPRRSTKTTSIQNVLLGRCATIPGYQVVSTAQDGTRASQFFRDMMDLIEAHATELMDARNEELAESYEGDKEPPEITLKEALLELGIRQLYYSQQREYIRWRNGSKWRVAKPEPSGLRGGAADVIWFDEAGELDPEEGPALMAGALPMMDTKPRSQILVSGTPAPQRAGLLWNSLEAGRAKQGPLGIVDYSMTDYADPHDETTWWGVHAGLACGLTTIETLRERYNDTDMPIEKFMMEYLCWWPPDSKITALDLKKWGTTDFEPRAEPPEDVSWGIGYDVAPDGTSAAVAVAWLDAAGDPWVQVMRARLGGSAWLEDYLFRAQSTHKRVPIGYDSIGENIAVAQGLQRRPRFNNARLKSLNLREVGAATASLAQALDSMALRHAEHPGLNGAVKNASWRQSGDTRLFARKGGQICELMACVHALAVVNTMPVKRKLTLPDAAMS